MNVLANPEVKKNTALLLAILLLFMCLVVGGLMLFERESKASFVEMNAAIVGTVLDQNPELESVIVPLITKGINDEQNMARGLAVLETYGYNKNLSHDLIPKFNEVYTHMVRYSIVVLVLVSVLILVTHFRYQHILFARIRQVTLYADHVLEGNYNLQLPETKEGDFSKLSHSMNRMRLAIQRHIQDLTNEKQFLVRLMSDISHQLKTPLASLMMYTDILTERTLTKEQQSMFLKNSAEQLERMNWLIQSLLKLAKLDVGAIQFQRTKGRLNETVQASVDLLKGMAEHHQVHVETLVKSECIMAHDKEWVTEALLNLIKNAIEHTPQGGHVFVELEQSTAVYKIHIRDEGMGIERDEIPHIFERFYKGKKNNKTGSVGIGLSLSKSIVEGHQGYIQVHSVIGNGTTFTIVFPRLVK